jgi:hypothetical protein
VKEKTVPCAYSYINEGEDHACAYTYVSEGKDCAGHHELKHHWHKEEAGIVDETKRWNIFLTWQSMKNLIF